MARRRHPTARTPPAPAARSGLYVALAFLIAVFNLLGLVMVMSASAVVAPRRLRLVLVLRAAAGRLGRRRRGGARRRGPHRLPPVAPVLGAVPARGARAAGPGAGARHRRGRQRRHPVDRGRVADVPAVGGRQAGGAHLGGRPVVAPGRLHAQHPGDAASRDRGARDDRNAGHAPAQPGHDDRHRRHRARAVLRRRSADRTAGRMVDLRPRRGDQPGAGRPVPAGPGAHLPRPVGRPDGQGLPEHPVAGRPGVGGHRRLGPGRQPGQVGLPPLRPLRLHLRHHRRGAGVGRCHRRGRPVRAARHHRHPHRPPRARPLRSAHRHRGHGLVLHAGVRQHRICDRHPSHHRRAAALRQRRRFLPRVRHGRRRTAALGRPAGHGALASPARPGRDR